MCAINVLYILCNKYMLCYVMLTCTLKTVDFVKRSNINGNKENTDFELDKVTVISNICND